MLKYKDVDNYLQLEEAHIERTLELMCLSAKDVTPKERHQLRHLIRYYMKKPHPFTACVRDNIKRFGRERAKRVCAVIKDLGKGTTKWRKGRQTGFSELSEPILTDRMAEILDEASQNKKFMTFLQKS